MKSLIRKILKESLLLESRVDSVFKKYIKKYESLLEKSYSPLASFNPKTSKPHTISEIAEDSLWDLITDLTNGHLDNGRIPLNEKYLDWLVKTYLQQWEGSIKPPKAHVELFIKTVYKFDKNLPKIGTDGFKEHLKSTEKTPIAYRAHEEKILNNISDINVYPDFATLRFVVVESEDYITPSQKKKIIRDETNRIYEDDRWLIIEPLSEKSSCMYGQGTQWCTAAKEGNQFTTYHNNSGTLYYIINKDDDEKWALQVGFEMVINEDWDYCSYDLYDDEDTVLHGGHYYGKGDLDEPLIGWVPDFPMEPYKAIENHYNKRLKEIDVPKIDYSEIREEIAQWMNQSTGIPLDYCFGIIDYDNYDENFDEGGDEEPYNELQTNLNHAFQNGELPNIPKLGEMFLNNDEGDYQLSLLEDED